MAATDAELDQAPPAGGTEPVAASATPRAPDPPDAAPAKGKKDKGKKDAKDKKGKAQDAAGAGGAPSIAAHPRARRAIARAKAWGGLAGFVLGGYLSLPTHTVADAGMRALIAGVVGYVAVWAGSVFVWRRLVMLELRAHQQQLLTGAGPGRTGPGTPPGGRQGP